MHRPDTMFPYFKIIAPFEAGESERHNPASFCANCQEERSETADFRTFKIGTSLLSSISPYIPQIMILL